MPYGYYTMVRIVATILFVIFARRYYVVKKEELVITFSVLVLLFQQLIKISFGMDVWNLLI